MTGLKPDLEHRFDFGQRVERQMRRRRPWCARGALGRRTIRRPDRTRRSSPGAGRRRSCDAEEPAEPHDLRDPVEIAERRMRLREHVDDAEPGRLARGVDSAIGLELALVALVELAVGAERDLAGDEQQASRRGQMERNWRPARRVSEERRPTPSGVWRFRSSGGTPRKAGSEGRPRRADGRWMGWAVAAGKRARAGFADRFSPMSPAERRQACFCLSARLGLRAKRGCAGGL